MNINFNRLIAQILSPNWVVSGI